VAPIGPIEMFHERPWAKVLRVPLVDRTVWFKVCAPVQAFEPRLTAELFARWPQRVVEVLAHDSERGWLLLADAGTPLHRLGNPPEMWLRALPLYAELQRGEAAWTDDHLVHGVPDLRVATWPARFEDLVNSDLPLDSYEVGQLEDFAPRFSELCAELAAYAIPETVQHDDLHVANVFQSGEHLRVIDWGDASISHPFVSLVVTFRFLEERNKLTPHDAWFARLRDAYLEPWGVSFSGAFAIAMRAGAFAHSFAWARHRDAMPDVPHPQFDQEFAAILRRAIAQTPD
jgi:hypothetical protein